MESTLTTTRDYTSLVQQLTAPAMRSRMMAKATQSLQEHFLTRAAASPAWDLSAPDDAVVAADWLEPGEYPLMELQERFAPRFMNNPGTADPNYQIIAASVIESFSSILKTLLLFPEQAHLLEPGVDAEDVLDVLHQEVLTDIGAPICQEMAAALRQEKILLSAAGIRSAAKRRMLSDVVTLQERQQQRRELTYKSARYAQLHKKWQIFSGDLHRSYIAVDSPLAEDLVEFLQNLEPSDAAIFLSLHHESAKIAAGHGLSADFCEKISKALAQSLRSTDAFIYQRVAYVLETISEIAGKKTITISTHDGKFMKAPMDELARVGMAEPHLAYFVHALVTGFVVNAGVMVRSLVSETQNIFDPEKGVFVQESIKHLYGIMLDHGQYHGLTSAQVYDAHTKRDVDGTTRAREPNIRCLDWPTSDVSAPPSSQEKA